ncbi:unnamed protein product [Periconia digitata]|uniref:Uncharacterized protein n=1 Tax=Periconia digitata TaxID=1303443 RepID=A0A9W4URK6_9PLEO|nr:unnamed protein product [Periconia digitata]
MHTILFHPTRKKPHWGFITLQLEVRSDRKLHEEELDCLSSNISLWILLNALSPLLLLFSIALLLLGHMYSLPTRPVEQHVVIAQHSQARSLNARIKLKFTLSFVTRTSGGWFTLLYIFFTYLPTLLRGALPHSTTCMLVLPSSLRCSVLQHPSIK